MRVRTIKPRGPAVLNTANPLVGSFSNIWIAEPESRRFTEMLRGRNGAFGSGNTFAATNEGTAIGFGGDNTSDIAVGDSGGSGGPSGSTFTLIFRVWMSVVSATRGIFGGSNTGCVEFRIDTGKLDLLKQQVADIGASTGTIAAGRWYSVAVSYDGTTAQYYIDGVPAGSASSAQTFTLRQMYLGAAPFASDRLAGVSLISFGAVSDRVLSAGIIASVSQNPWQLFLDDHRPRAFAAAPNTVTQRISMGNG